MYCDIVTSIFSFMIFVEQTIKLNKFLLREISLKSCILFSNLYFISTDLSC